MRLIDNAEAVLKHAWSVRLLVLLSMLEGAQVVIPIFTDNPPFDRTTFAAISFVLTVAVIPARFLYQPKVSGGDV